MSREHRSKPDSFMPIWIADYLADTMHLNAAGHGAYFLALMHYWRTGPLPNDPATLCRICRVERSEWDGIAIVLLPFFTPSADGMWLHQKRMDAERAKAQVKHAARKNAGLRGADAKWDGKRMAMPSPDAWQTDGKTMPSYIPHSTSSLSSERKTTPEREPKIGDPFRTAPIPKADQPDRPKNLNELMCTPEMIQLVPRFPHLDGQRGRPALHVVVKMLWKNFRGWGWPDEAMSKLEVIIAKEGRAHRAAWEREGHIDVEAIAGHRPTGPPPDDDHGAQ